MLVITVVYGTYNTTFVNYRSVVTKNNIREKRREERYRWRGEERQVERNMCPDFTVSEV